MEYEILIVNKCNSISQPATDGRFFVIITANNGKNYQVKFNVNKSKGNQKELITNFIGKQMKASVLEGAFLRFSQKQINVICDYIKNVFHSKEPNMECFSKNILFGIEWHDGAYTATSEDDVPLFIATCKNTKDFYAIFPFDQYLRNFDRQYFNHLAIKRNGDTKPSHYAIIDGDRIFKCTSWDLLKSEKDKFDCFKEPFHLKLYNLVDDSTFTHIFASKAQISLLEIHKLEKIMKEIYDDPQLENSTIFETLAFRKEEIFNYCNGDCFHKVTKKTLGEDKSHEYYIASSV